MRVAQINKASNIVENVLMYDELPADTDTSRFVEDHAQIAVIGQPSPGDAALGGPFVDTAAAADAAEQTRLDGMRADTNYQQLINQARTATVSQIDTWIANNVTTLAQARTVLAALVKYVATRGT